MKSFISTLTAKSVTPPDLPPEETPSQADFHPLTRVLTRDDSSRVAKKSSRGVWSSLVKSTQEAQGKKAPPAGNIPLSIQPIGAGKGNHFVSMSEKSLPEATSMYVLLKVRREFSHDDLVQIRKNLETMEQARASGDKSTLKTLNKEFARIHGSFFVGCDFRNDKQAAAFSGLKERLLQEERKQNAAGPSTSPVSTPSVPESQTISFRELARIRATQLNSEMEQSSATQALVQSLHDKFMDSLLNIPLAETPPSSSTGTTDRGETATDKVEAANPENLYVRAESAGQLFAQLPRFGMLIKSRPDGDCLLHALAGRDLLSSEIIEVRKKIADVKRHAPETPGLNTVQLIEGMLQSPHYKHVAMALMTNREGITNEVYANFQALPGTYAGKDELLQWTTANPNRQVLVLDDTDSTIAALHNGTGTMVAKSELENSIMEADIILYKSADHWQQLLLHPQWQTKSTRFDPVMYVREFREESKPNAKTDEYVADLKVDGFQRPQSIKKPASDKA